MFVNRKQGIVEKLQEDKKRAIFPWGQKSRKGGLRERQEKKHEGNCIS